VIEAFFSGQTRFRDDLLRGQEAMTTGLRQSGFRLSPLLEGSAAARLWVTDRLHAVRIFADHASLALF